MNDCTRRDRHLAETPLPAGPRGFGGTAPGRGVRGGEEPPGEVAGQRNVAALPRRKAGRDGCSDTMTQPIHNYDCKRRDRPDR